jgi:hypothetical protein
LSSPNPKLVSTSRSSHMSRTVNYKENVVLKVMINNSSSVSSSDFKNFPLVKNRSLSGSPGGRAPLKGLFAKVLKTPQTAFPRNTNGDHTKPDLLKQERSVSRGYVLPNVIFIYLYIFLIFIVATKHCQMRVRQNQRKILNRCR